MEIYLTFAYPISEAYREKLQTFSDTILAKGFTKHQPPRIWFPGIKKETSTGIDKLLTAYDDCYEA